MREFTLMAVLTGSALGLIFAASSLYLVLKIGLTVSASIPVAVLAITLFKGFSKVFGLRQATILENNITQTAGSAGESIAFGVGVTMPALMMLGFGMDLGRVMVVSILGGLLGILAMIPLRRAFIVNMHGKPGEPGKLLFPEGTACAQVLISGEKGGATGQTVFLGFGIAFIHKFIVEGMSLLTGVCKFPLTFINKSAVFAQEMASELLGVGYIIGLRTGAMMMGGAVLGYLVIIPLIYFIGEHTDAIIPPGKKLIREMSVKQIRDGYLLFVGAGCVATAGIISMLKTLPIILRGLLASLSGGSGGAAAADSTKRTDNDMPMKVVILGSLGLVGILTLFLAQQVDPVKALLGAGLVVVFGFLFVTVSSRLTGEIGSSSNPISGMTVATLMLTCLIFVSLGMTSVEERVLALCIAAVVCVASSNGGSTAQSLKTGFLVGGTPKAGQYAILVGALISAALIGGTLILFNESKVIYSQRPDLLPQVTLTQAELGRLKQTEKHEGLEYAIFDTRNEELTKPAGDYVPRPDVAAASEGRYLVDKETGKIRFLKDSTIMGKLTARDDGTPVDRKFDAPKTQVMSIIINGVLKQELNWSMIGLGAMIALMLELCGVSALAFAVGLYVPISISTPIFLGGIIRFLVDRKFAKQGEAAIKAAGNDPEKRAMAEIEALRKSETSSGVLLASGYIAGGSIAGMVIAFVAFNDNWPDDLLQYQYGKAPIARVSTLEEAADDFAQQKLGYNRAELTKEIASAEKPKVEPKVEAKDKDGKPAPKTVAKKPDLTPAEKKLEALNELRDEVIELSANEPYRWVTVKAGTVLKVPGVEPLVVSQATTIAAIAKDLYNDEKPEVSRQISELNTLILGVKEGADPQKIAVPAGTELKIPKRFKVESDKPLPELAAELLGRARKAPQLFKNNATVLELPKTLPVGAELTKPQADWPSWAVFGGLMLLLLVVGRITPKE